MAYSSRIAFVEVSRTLHRFRLQGLFTREAFALAEVSSARISSVVERFPISEEILDLASLPLRVHIKTLDAIHLATARIIRDLYGPDITFATHDRQLAHAATLFGFTVVGA